MSTDRVSVAKLVRETDVYIKRLVVFRNQLVDPPARVRVTKTKRVAKKKGEKS